MLEYGVTDMISRCVVEADDENPIFLVYYKLLLFSRVCIRQSQTRMQENVAIISRNKEVMITWLNLPSLNFKINQTC